LGQELMLDAGVTTEVVLDPNFEHGVLVMTGVAEVDGHELKPGSLLYLDRGQPRVRLHAAEPTRLFLLGGEPFDEPLVMWWNFVARTHEEIVEARADWEHDRVAGGDRFGTVTGYAGDPLPAPDLPTVRLKARGRDGTVRG